MMFEEINNEELGHVYFLLKNKFVFFRKSRRIEL